MKRTSTLSPRRLFVFIFLMTILSLNSVSASGLKGTYTINPAKAASATNYTSFNDADSDLVYGSRSSGGSANGPGVTAAVLFKVADGTYLESVDIPYIAGTSASNTVTFQGHPGDSTKVIVTWTATGSFSTLGYTIHLDNTSFIKLNELTIQMTMGGASYSYYDHALVIDNVSDSDTVSNCLIMGAFSPLSGGKGGTNFYGACIYSGYNPSTYTYSVDQYNVIYNNHLMYGYYGMFWQGPYTSGSAELGNIIDHNILDSNGYYGMYILIQDGVTITNNKINAANKTLNYALYTFYLGYSYYGSTTTNLIANNFISATGSPNNYGLFNYYSQNSEIAYNNIYTDGSASYSAYIMSFSASTLAVDNNNFIASNGLCLYAQGLTDEDYNNYYTGGATIINYSGTSYSSVSAWNTSGVGFGSNDISSDPLFVSTTDLHVNNPALNGTANPISGITTDIDWETRNSTTPDIGADEFTPPALKPVTRNLTSPNSGFCVGNQDVIVNLSNYGLTTLTSVHITWSVNGTAQTPVLWTGSLASSLSTTVKLGTYNFSSATTVYAVSVLADSANAVSVSYPGLSSNVRAGLSGTFLIDNSGAGTPDYTSFRAAASDLNLKGTCGAVTFNVASGTYNESFAINTIPNSSATNTVTFQSKAGTRSSVILDTLWGGTNPGTAYTVLLNGASYVTFQNMTVYNYLSAGFGYADVFALTGQAHHITFNSNDMMSNTTTGVSNYGGVIDDLYGSVENYITVKNCHLSGSYYTINLEGASGGIEFGHYLYNNIIDSFIGYGIMGEYVDSMKVSRNKVSSSNGYGGVYIFAYNPSSTDTVIVDNNFISCSGTYAYGLTVTYCINANVYYNTVVSSTTMPYYYTGYFYNSLSGSTVNVIDNIFYNDNGGIAIFGNATGLTNSDYNDLYTTGNIGSWNYVACPSFADWQSASALDVNSVTGDPMLKNISNGDLHVTGKSKIVIHKGTPVAGYNIDIDSTSNVRNSTSPNIGADETPLVANDIATDEIDSPVVGFCSGTKAIWATISNAGTNNITSCTVSWSVDGVAMTPYLWTGTMKPGDVSMLKLGSITFTKAKAKAFFVWATLPNGVASTVTGNDSASGNYGGGLNGTYKVGGKSPDYASFREATNALNTVGVCGPVIFNVDSGYYNESVTVKNIIGTSPINTITFMGKDTALTILDTATSGSYGAPGFTIKLDGAQYVTFSKMTITNTGTTLYAYDDVALLTNSASYNTFSGNIMTGNTGGGFNYGSVIYLDPNSAQQYNTIKNNELNGDFYTVWLASYTVYSFGNILANNTIDSGNGYSVYAYYQDSLSITGNKIMMTAGYCGLYVYNCAANGSGTDSTLIMNNFITCQGSYSYGLYVGSCALINIYNNSINTTTSSIYYASAYFYGASSGSTNVEDNVFVNDGGGLALYTNGSSAISYIDFNDYYTGGGDIASWAGTICSTVSDLQSADGMDANSVSGDPAYNNASIGDLHATSLSTIISNAGTPLFSALLDIDGNARSATKPDMGADEFGSNPNDLGVAAVLSPVTKSCGAAATSVEINVYNPGTNPESSYSVNVIVTNGAKTYTASRTISRTINAGATDTFWLSSFSPTLNTSAGGTYKIKAYTSLSTDGDHTNDTDTVSVTLVVPPTSKFSVANSGTICQGDSFAVTDKSTSSGATYKYLLVNSSGSTVATSTAKNPFLSDKNNSGAYRIVQEVYSGSACFDSTSVPVTINPGPTASFNVSSACPNDTVFFKNTSTAGTGGTISTYLWDLSGGTKAVSADTFKIYPKGTYSIKLSVTNTNGCANSTTKTFTIDTVNASFTYTKAKDGTVSFNANDNSMAKYDWDFNDGSIHGSGNNPIHKYTKVGRYTVTLNASKSSGCSGSWFDTFYVSITGMEEEVTQGARLAIYPNPFREYTTVAYTLDKSSSVKVEVMDVLGRSVATLVNAVNQPSGDYNVKFNAAEYNGTNAGVYIVRMTIGDHVITKQIMLVK